MLNSVLLPLPFGPAMPKISPASTLKETPSTALRAPNDLATLSTTSRAMWHFSVQPGLNPVQTA